MCLHITVLNHTHWAAKTYRDMSLMANIQRCSCGAERIKAWERPYWGPWS